MSYLPSWMIWGGLLLAATGLFWSLSDQAKGPALIPGDQPVSEAQVKQKLEVDGWSNVQVVREGRNFEAIATKDGQNRKIVVEAQTGRLVVAADEDDD